MFALAMLPADRLHDLLAFVRETFRTDTIGLEAVAHVPVLKRP